jgi:hypothetical protein
VGAAAPLVVREIHHLISEGAEVVNFAVRSDAKRTLQNCKELVGEKPPAERDPSTNLRSVPASWLNGGERG